MKGLWLVDNQHMRIRFTKMQGAGNDFVVLDETRERLNLSPAHYRYLADRHFGVGADQILTVRPAPQADVDFEYVIHNADGGEVEQCGNGSRCFVRFVQEQGLTDKESIRVKVHGGVIELHALANGQVLPPAKLEAPRQSSHGDLACSLAMQCAKVLRLKPRDIAEQLAASVVYADRESRGLIDTAEVAGAGFINLRLSLKAKQAVLQTMVEQGEAFRCQPLLQAVSPLMIKRRDPQAA